MGRGSMASDHTRLDREGLVEDQKLNETDTRRDKELTELMIPLSPVVSDSLVFVHDESIHIQHFQTSGDSEAALTGSCSSRLMYDRVKVEHKLTNDEDCRLLSVSIVLFSLPTLEPVLAIRLATMLDSSSSPGTCGLFESLKFSKLGEKGEDFPFAIFFLGQPASASASTLLGLEVEEELNSLHLANSIKVADARRGEVIGGVDCDGLDITTILFEKG